MFLSLLESRAARSSDSHYGKTGRVLAAGGNFFPVGEMLFY
jgi:hypothetical protein